MRAAGLGGPYAAKLLRSEHRGIAAVLMMALLRSRHAPARIGLWAASSAPDVRRTQPEAGMLRSRP